MDPVLLTLTILTSLESIAAIYLFLQLKRQANNALNVAVVEFHNAAESLLRTPNDLPLSVIELLSVFNDSAFEKWVPLMMYQNLRLDRKGKLKLVGGRRIDSDLLQLRPELKELLKMATLSWYSIILNRSVILGVLMRFEMKELKLLPRNLGRSNVNETETLRILPNLNGFAT